MTENNNPETGTNKTRAENKSLFDLGAVYTALILNWKWFLISLTLCLSLVAIYLRYATPVYMVAVKLLIKNEDSGRRANNIQYASNLGTMSNSTGLDNEMEILKSHSIAEAAVRDLKLYVTYIAEGKIKDNPVYRTEPVSVDIDTTHLNRLASTISLSITREDNAYNVKGEYYAPTAQNREAGVFTINKTLRTLPATIQTHVGTLSFQQNGVYSMPNGSTLRVYVSPPKSIANGYAGGLGVTQTSKTTSIVSLTLTDQVPQRGMDYLKQLAICYNRQANEDKNEIAVRTERFINERLEKINNELGNTEGQIENYKRRNNMTQQSSNAGLAMQNTDAYQKKLSDANTQLALLNNMEKYIGEPANKYQTLPSNIGLSDQTSNDLISKYNEIVLQRNRLLRSAAEGSPMVTPLTAQLNDLMAGIKRAMAQSRRAMEIQRNVVATEYGRYAGQLHQSPEQERILTQIGRQQEVKSGLYLMLLQKREENSISLAATADKGRMIDTPIYAGQVSPKSTILILIALGLGLAIPALIIFIIRFLRYVGV